ncbi:MAG: anti-sigma factor family protein, partial [Nitrospiria bacterium]
LRVQCHLEDCPYCQEIYRQEKEHFRAIEAANPTHLPPDRLRVKISKALRQSESVQPMGATVARSPRVGFLTVRFASAMAMLILVVTGLILYALPKYLNQNRNELVRVAVKTHEVIAKGKESCDLTWLIPKVQFSPLHLICGKLVQILDGDAALLNYESLEGKVSLLMKAAQPLNDHQVKESLSGEFGKRHIFRSEKYKGHYAVFWTDPMWSYVLVSDQKERIAEACQICHRGPKRYNIDGV